MISISEVKKIASLARLKLTVAEEKRHAETISVVLDYMKILDEVNIQGVVQTSQVTGLEDVVREDEINECDHKAELQKQLPGLKFGKLEVPGVFNEAENSEL